MMNRKMDIGNDYECRNRIVHIVGISHAPGDFVMAVVLSSHFYLMVTLIGDF